MGRTFVISSRRIEEPMVSSTGQHGVHVAPDGVDLAVVQIKRLGWARFQLGAVLVEKRLCTMPMADS